MKVNSKHITVLFCLIVLIFGLCSSGLAARRTCSELPYLNNCPPDKPCLYCEAFSVCNRWEITEESLNICEESCEATCVALAILATKGQIPPENVIFGGYLCEKGCPSICSLITPKSCVVWGWGGNCYCEGDMLPESSGTQEVILVCNWEEVYTEHSEKVK